MPSRRRSLTLGDTLNRLFTRFVPPKRASLPFGDTLNRLFPQAPYPRNAMHPLVHGGGAVRGMVPQIQTTWESLSNPLPIERHDLEPLGRSVCRCEPSSSPVGPSRVAGHSLAIDSSLSDAQFTCSNEVPPGRDSIGSCCLVSMPTPCSYYTVRLTRPSMKSCVGGIICIAKPKLLPGRA